jgi:enoyl-CoA hydratase
MSYQFIKIKRENEAAVVYLNRPREMNALNKAMVEELDRAFSEMADDDDIKAVVLTGEKNFAAGADITGMLTLTPDEARGFSFSRSFNNIEAFPKPVIAAIYGFALGGGLELALTCDMRVAAPGAKLGFPEINLGIFPGAGGTQRLPRLIGPGRAKEMIFGGNAIDAGKALEYGLINMLAEDPREEALKIAGRLAAKAPIALKLAKQCIGMAFDLDQNNGIEFEAAAWASTFATEDQREGMQAFVEKRRPIFKGK